MPHREPVTIPSFYNDLAGSLQQSWRLLSRAAADRHSAMHTPVAATIGLDGTPRARVVVLRHADASAWKLRFHTDKRSAKVDEISGNDAVQIVAYDPAEKIQLRLTGVARVHTGDADSSAAWLRSQPQSQLCYRQAAAPGMIAGDPLAAGAAAECDGLENFAAVSVTVRELEWLYLAHTGHRRARFTRDGHDVRSCWLAP